MSVMTPYSPTVEPRLIACVRLLVWGKMFPNLVIYWMSDPGGVLCNLMSVWASHFIAALVAALCCQEKDGADFRSQI